MEVTAILRIQKKLIYIHIFSVYEWLQYYVTDNRSKMFWKKSSSEKFLKIHRKT